MSGQTKNQDGTSEDDYFKQFSDMPENVEVCKNPTHPTLPTQPIYSKGSIQHQPNTNPTHPTRKGKNDDQDDTTSQRETADQVIKTLKGRITYHVKTSEWYIRERNIMVVLHPDSVDKYIINALDKIKSKKYSYSMVTSIKSFIKGLLSVESFEESRNLLPLTNGVFNLKTNQLDSYEKYQFNWVLPYAYNPEAKCPSILRYLATATGRDKYLINFLLAWMRVLIAGDFTVQKYIELVGGGGTGKSTFLELCTLIVGENNRVVTDLKSLEGNRFESANLQDKRLALITDSTRYGGEVAILKAITGGDVIRSEKKNKQAGQGFKFQGLVMIASNEQIQSSDYTSGLARRKIPVVFNARVTDKEKARYKHGIIHQMKRELPGLLNILLNIELSEAVNLVKSPEGTLAKIKIQNELNTNPILAWMNDRLIVCKQGDHSFIGAGAKKTDLQADIVRNQNTKLYPNYCSWCEEEGKHPVSNRRFSELVIDNAESHGISTAKIRSNVGAYLEGLRLRKDTDTNILLLLLNIIDSVGLGSESVGLSSESVGTNPASDGSVGCVGLKQSLGFEGDNTKNGFRL